MISLSPSLYNLLRKLSRRFSIFPVSCCLINSHTCFEVKVKNERWFIWGILHEYSENVKKWIHFITSMSLLHTWGSRSRSEQKQKQLWIWRHSFLTWLRQFRLQLPPKFLQWNLRNWLADECSYFSAFVESVPEKIDGAATTSSTGRRIANAWIRKPI